MDYKQIQSGKWITPKQEGYRLACCDCGLVHTMDFRLNRGVIEFKMVERDEKETAILREIYKFLPDTRITAHVTT